MWHIAATVYFLLGGHPDDGHVFVNRKLDFQTEAACKEFVASSDFESSKAELVAIISRHFGDEPVPEMDVVAKCIDSTPKENI
jgi:Sin3 binding region of histone deacetylase complex subunit SAP30